MKKANANAPVKLLVKHAHGALTADEQTTLNEWLQKSDDNRAVFERFNAALQDDSPVMTEVELECEWRDFKSNYSTKEKKLSSSKSRYQQFKDRVVVFILNMCRWK